MNLHTIKNLEPAPPTLKRPPRPLWMYPKYIRLIYTWTSLRCNPRHNRNVARCLNKSIRRSLLVESPRQSDYSATAIGACLDPSAGETDPRRAYAILKHWYRHAFTWLPNPSRTDTEKVRGDFQTLYHGEYPQPPILPLETHVDPGQVNNAVPSEAEVETPARHLRLLKAVGRTHLRAEHFKQCLQEAHPGRTRRPPRGRSAGFSWWTSSNTCGKWAISHRIWGGISW